MKNAVPNAGRTAAEQVPKTKTKTKSLTHLSLPSSFKDLGVKKIVDRHLGDRPAQDARRSKF